MSCCDKFAPSPLLQKDVSYVELVGIREVKNGLSRYLSRVKAGETITITERGVPVARLVPVENRLPAGAEELLQNGDASWRGGKPGSASPVSPRHKSAKTLGEMVAEDRR